MTREDAINYLKRSWAIDEDDANRYHNEVLEFTIKALEQKPCEDIMTIHTQGLDEGIRCAMCTNSMKSDRGCDGGCVVNEAMYKEVMNTIRNHIVPSVTPTRKKGKWIGHREHCENLGVIPSGLGAYEWCSNCDCGIDVREWHRNHYNYCPNCGSFMMEED